MFKNAASYLESLFDQVVRVIKFEGCEWQILLGLLTSFTPGRWGWSVSWLLASYPFSFYLIEQFRRKRDRKNTRIAHSIPLTTVQHSIPIPVVVTIKIVKATLMAVALESGDVSDPYVIVEIHVPGSKTDKRSTSTKYKTRCPVWNEEFRVLLPDLPLALLTEITFTLMDKDVLTADDNNGCSPYPLVSPADPTASPPPPRAQLMSPARAAAPAPPPCATSSTPPRPTRPGATATPSAGARRAARAPAAAPVWLVSVWPGPLVRFCFRRTGAAPSFLRLFVSWGRGHGSWGRGRRESIWAPCPLATGPQAPGVDPRVA